MKFEPKKLKFVHEFPEDREWLDEERLKAKLVYYDAVMIGSISYDSDAKLFNIWFEDFKYKYPNQTAENSSQWRCRKRTIIVLKLSRSARK